jgi:Acyl-CoA dehydrogenase, C-terminal domain
VDFDLDSAQERRREALTAVLAGAWQVPVRRADAQHVDLDTELAGSPLVTDPGLRLLDRILLAEQAAHSGAPVDVTAVLVLRGELGDTSAGPLAARRGGDEQPFRFAAAAMRVVDVSGAEPAIGAVVPGSLAPIESGMVDGYGTVATETATAVAWALPLSPLLVYCLGRSAEAAGTARAAIELTADHLNRRRQFGVALSSLQAIRHRMSELAVDVECLGALVRLAADHQSEASVVAACALAVDIVPKLVQELHQLSGARGFVYEYGLPARTMQLMATRGELVDAGMTAVAVADATVVC